MMVGIYDEYHPLVVHIRLFYPVSEYHNEPGLQYHVVRDVSIITGHHHHGLFPRYPLANILFVLPPVHLPGLQGLKAGGPPSLVCILH